MENGDYNNNLPQKQETQIIQDSGAELLEQIRPYWKAKKLITRVKALLPVDPSSACQRIFNAAIHDLKEKIVLAGLDIAKEAAESNGLPTISKAEDIRELNTSKVISLAYRMGLLTRPEYRKLSRAYDIRKDLEHEDDEYEAGIEDCVYMFKTTIDVVLSKDPIELIKVQDFKDIIEQPEPAQLGASIITDYSSAPTQRQLEIASFLFYNALDESKPEIVRQNCFNALPKLKPHIDNNVLIDLSTGFAKKLGRRQPKFEEARAAFLIGIMPYIRKATLEDFYNEHFERLKASGFKWGSHSVHTEQLKEFREIGGLRYVPNPLSKRFIKWLLRCYLGEGSGGTKVYYSWSGAKVCEYIFKDSSDIALPAVEELHKRDNDIKRVTSNKYVEKRYQHLLDVLQL